MENMELGDIVYLRSGSARQTIIAKNVNEYGVCDSITTAWVHYETQVPHSMTAHPHAFMTAAQYEQRRNNNSEAR